MLAAFASRGLNGHDVHMTLLAPPDVVVLDFIFAMNRWEVFAWTARREATRSEDPSSHLRAVTQALAEVFAQHCTPRELTLERASSFENPPRYDPSRETVVELQVDTESSIVTTKRLTTAGSVRFQYGLVLAEGAWLIDRLRKRDGATWVPAAL